MIPGMMGMNSNLPSVKELWKDEKSKYRHWVIILAIGLLVIAALSLTSFIFNLIDQDEIIKNIRSSYERNLKREPSEYDAMAKQSFVTNNIVFASLIVIATIAGVIWYFTSLVKVYKYQNFAQLSNWPILIVGIGAFMSFIQLLNFAFSIQARASMFATNGRVFSFATRIIYILIYFVASSPISRVRRIFLASDRMEKLKTDPQFQAMQQQMKGIFKGGKMPYGPFGPVMAPPLQPSTPPQNHKPGATSSPPISEEDAQLKRLKGLSVEKLKEVAKRLSISGYRFMKKDELIEAIMRVSKT